jgi:phage recombination protein Bet
MIEDYNADLSPAEQSTVKAVLISHWPGEPGYKRSKTMSNTETAIVKAARPQGELVVPDTKIQLLKDTICKGATNDELQLFVEVCNRYRLDPFAKQIYAIKRKSKDASGNWKENMVFQTSIDGFRAIAEQTSELDGQEGPFWCGPDGQWVDVWLKQEPPMAAKVTVYRKGRSRGWVGTATWDSYVQSDRDGKPTKFWKQMPDVMLAKCAESLALRKAFPADLSGLYTAEEMGQADNDVPANGNGHIAKGQGAPTTPKDVLKILTAPAESAPVVADNQERVVVEADEVLTAEELAEKFYKAVEARKYSREAGKCVLADIEMVAAFAEAWKDDPNAAMERTIANLNAGKYDKALAKVRDSANKAA